MPRRAVLATVASLVLVLCLGTAHGVSNGGDWGVPSFPVGVNLPHFGRKDGAYGAHTSVDFEGSSTGIFLDLWKVASNWWGRICYPLSPERACDFDRAPDGYWTGESVAAWIDNDPDGYPAQLVDSINGYERTVCADIGYDAPHIAPDTYIVTYSGQGELQYEKDAQLVSSAPGRDVIQVTAPANGIRVCLMSTNSSDPLHGITILPQAMEGTYSDAQPFQTNFTDALQPFGMLRFPAWQRTEWGANHQRQWGSRTLPSQRQSTGRGVAIEFMIQLCNTVGAAPWFHLSQSGEDGGTDFLQNFAQLVLDTLDPSLPVYVAYAHGVGFNQWDKFQDMAAFADFAAVFDAANATNRLQHVHSSPYSDHILPHWGDDLPQLDAIAIPAAVAMPLSAHNAILYYNNLTVDQGFALLRTAILDAEQLLHTYIQRAHAANVEMWAYDFGFFLRGSTRHTDNLHMARAHTDNRNYPRTVTVFDAAANNGTGDWLDVTLINETHPMPISRTHLLAQVQGARDRLRGVLTQQVALRFTGMFTSPTAAAGDVEFQIVADDGFRLWLDGTVVMEANSIGQHTIDGTVTLPASPVSLRLEMFQFNGDLGIVMRYRLPGDVDYTVVPASSFAHATPAGTAQPGLVAEYWYYIDGWTIDAIPDDLLQTQPDFVQTVDKLELWAQWDSDPWLNQLEAALEPYYATTNASYDAGMFLEERYNSVAYVQAEHDIHDLLDAMHADSRMRDYYMDWLERWRRMGGGMLAAQELTHGACRLGKCPSSHSPLWRGLRDWSQGQAGNLPFTAADMPSVPPPACNPACQWGVCVEGTCQCFAGYSGAACDVGGGAKARDCAPAVGVNLDGLADYGTELSYLNAFKRSRNWVTHAFTSYEWNTNAPLNLDANGYPQGLPPDTRAGAMMMRDLEGHGVSGTYTILYDGDGIVQPSMSDVVATRRIAPGHIEVDLHLSTGGNNGLEFVIERSNPDDYIRNVRILSPGYSEAEVEALVFHPTLVHSLRHSQVVRFQNWQDANGPQQPHWANRTTRSTASYNWHYGAPVEDMILLANMAGVDPWFSMPYNADDDYIAQFAALVRDTLRPDVTAYIEFGNEPWHTGFSAGAYAQELGSRLGMNEEGNSWWGGAINEARFCAVGNLTRNIAHIWEREFGPSQRHRFKVVLEGQYGWDITSAKLLECGNTSAVVDYLALAPYFGGIDANAAASAGRTADGSIDAGVLNGTLEAAMSGTIAAYIEGQRARLAPHREAAQEHGVGFITYEAGYGATGPGGPDDIAIQAALDPRMADLYVHYMDMLTEEGIELIMQFTSISQYSQFGSWGLKRATDQDPREAPKMQGWLAWIEDHQTCDWPEPAACPDAGTGVPCTGNGDCLPSGDCACYFRSKGAACEFVDPIKHFDCGYKCTFDQGECVLQRTAGVHEYYGCDCLPGYYGYHCQLSTCQQNCSFAGECMDHDVCSCYRGYKGDFCSTDCCGGSRHGRCASADDDDTCVCDEGYRTTADGHGCEPDCDCDVCSGPGACGCPLDCSGHGACVRGQCRCWAGFTGEGCAATEAPPNAGSPVGIGVNGLAYWATEYAFVDSWPYASEWFSGWDNALVDEGRRWRWNAGPDTEFRPDGYPARLQPGQTLSKLLHRNVQYHAPSYGQWTLLYDGDGELDLGMDATVVSRAKGVIRFTFEPTANMDCHNQLDEPYCGDNGIMLVLKTTNPDNPVHNIRMLHPGFPDDVAEAAPFHPWYLQMLERFSTIRFMDWLVTNHPAEGEGLDWAARSRIGDDLQARRPPPFERLIQLCNIVAADAWINVVHTASDEYVTAMAEALRDGLRDDVRVFVEYSNEVWNTFFPQGEYAQEQGLALGLDTDPRLAGHKFQARRSVEIFTIFKTVFGADNRHRLVHVLSTWGYFGCSNCGPVTTRTLLEFENTAAEVDALGVPGYFDCNGLGSDNKHLALGMSVEEMVQFCRDALADAQPQAEAAAAFGTEFGLPLVVYEGGPAIVEATAIHNGGVDVPLARKFMALHRHPDMQGLYRDYLELFKAAGIPGPGMPFMQFGSTSMPGIYGSWNIQEYMNQDVSELHKWRAINEWIDEHSQNNTGPLHARAGCYVADAPAVALGGNVRVGPPSVFTPRAGDVWMAGARVRIEWDPTGANPARPVQLRLWRHATCSSQGGELQGVLATGLRNTGFHTVQAPAHPPSGFGGGFILEIRTATAHNFSEPFAIEAPFHFAASEWGDCSHDCGIGGQERDVACLVHAVSLWQGVTSSAVSAGYGHTQRVPKAPCHLGAQCTQSPRSTDVRNQVCETPFGGTLLGLTYVIDRAVLDMCIVDDEGCRNYRTNWADNEALGHALGRPIKDCVELRGWNECGRDSCSYAKLGATPPLPAPFCAAFAAPPPAEQPCLEAPCASHGWLVGEWSHCSADCAGGNQTRSVTCVDAALNSAQLSLCLAVAPEPPSSRVCNAFACESYEWSTGSWSSCDVTCGQGMRQRSVTCVAESTGAPAGDWVCDLLTIPAQREPCNAGACVGAFGWLAGPWGPCSQACGGGVSKRNVTCHPQGVAGVLGNETAVDDSMCDAGAQPDDSRVCNGGSCDDVLWIAGAWGACSQSCGPLGVMTRSVQCASRGGQQVEPLAACASLPKPAAAVPCNRQPCNMCADGVDNSGNAVARCSGHGSCEAATGECSCTGGFHGLACDVPPSCAGSLDAAGACCSTVLDSHGACCSAAGAVVDRDGECCESGALDACGVCDGDAVVVDLAGACCSSGVLDARGWCCEAGLAVDECGVCGGDGSGCDTVVTLMVPEPSDADALDPLSDIYLPYMDVLASEFAAHVGVSAQDVAVLLPLEPPPTARRLQQHRQLRRVAGAVEVQVVLKATAVADEEQDPQPATKVLVEARLSDATRASDAPDASFQVVSTPIVRGVAVCGNGECEAGELCGEDHAEDCCFQDCQAVQGRCPVPQGATLPCGGPGRGVCLAASGQCDCFVNKGYTGRDCSRCAAGWSRTTSGECQYNVFLAASLANGGTTCSTDADCGNHEECNGSGECVVRSCSADDVPAPAVYRWVDGNGVARLVTNDCAAAGVSCTEGVTPTIPGMASYYIIGDFDAVGNAHVCV